jgi:sigma-B regulation protein RsbU (phosphoserine phosphatase)
MRHKRFSRIRDTFNTITDGLDVKEVQNLLKREVPEVYSFYVNRMEESDTKGKSLPEKIRFGRKLFKIFLLELSPARRIMYIISLLVFLEAILASSLGWAFVGFLILNLLIALELADKISSNEELSVARDIQNSLLPKSPPQNNHYDISCYSETAKSVGGDYFDFIAKENNLIIAIGDISGKGMAAAIHMVQVQALFRHILDSYSSPKEVLSQLNENLIGLFRPGTFFTINLASINPDGSVQLCRAGHPPVIYFSCREDKCINLTPKGIGIGLSKNGLFNNCLEEITITPEQGDILIFFTDGITEAMNNYLTEYGEDRLKYVIKNNATKSAQGIKSSIIDSIKRYTTDAPVYDDITLIVLKKKS